MRVVPLVLLALLVAGPTVEACSFVAPWPGQFVFWNGRHAISNDDGGDHWVDTTTNETRPLPGGFSRGAHVVIAPDGQTYASVAHLTYGSICPYAGGTYAVTVRDLKGNLLEQWNGTGLYGQGGEIWTRGLDSASLAARGWNGEIIQTMPLPVNSTGRLIPRGDNLAWEAVDGIHVRYGTLDRLVYAGRPSEAVLSWSALGTLAIAQRGGNSTAPTWNLTVVDASGKVDWYAEGVGYLNKLMALGEGWITYASPGFWLATEGDGVRPLNLARGYGVAIGGDGATVVVLDQKSTSVTTTNADGSLHIDMTDVGPEVQIVGSRVLRTVADAEAYVADTGDESKGSPSPGLLLVLACLAFVAIRRRPPPVGVVL